MIELLKETCIQGCYEIQPRLIKDNRGCFVKTFQFDVFKSMGLTTEFKEEYFSVSHRDVIRGLHFQLPPSEHIKLVYCIYGKVFDVVVDLRVGSPTYGQYVKLELNGEKANMVYIPAGVAHGFCTLSKTATLMYKVTTLYDSRNDSGIRWDSVGIPWPISNPIISDRDMEFKSLNDFKSPFVFEDWGR